MSYTKITIQGQEVGLKFGYEANKIFFTAFADNTEMYRDYDGNLSGLGYAKVLHSAYRNTCAIKEVQPTLTVSDFYDWVEQVPTNEIIKNQFAEAIKIWWEAQDTKRIVEKMVTLKAPEEVEEKKTVDLTT